MRFIKERGVEILLLDILKRGDKGTSFRGVRRAYPSWQGVEDNSFIPVEIKIETKNEFELYEWTALSFDEVETILIKDGWKKIV